MLSRVLGPGVDQLSENILSVSGLTVERMASSPQSREPVTRLLDGVSLSLRAGEVLGIVGGSGAGKSTLGRALLGYARSGVRISGGVVTYRGRDLLQIPEHELRGIRGGGIAYIAQNPAGSFNPGLTIGRQIVEVLRRHRALDSRSAKTEAAKLLTSLELPDPLKFMKRYAHQVSGGQAQRALIAMALAGGPSLLVLDEPTTALDPTTRATVVALITSVIRLHGTAAIYISHDLEVVNAIADRIIRLEKGVLMSEQDVAALMEEHAMPRPSRLQSRVKQLPEALLEVTDIRAGFATAQEILRGVSLTLRPGAIVGLVGQSGGGKSTLARIICGLHPDYEGHVSLSGQRLDPSIKRRAAEQARRVQMVYQSAEMAMNPQHTVEKIIGRVVHRHFGLDRKAVTAQTVTLLQKVGLDGSFLSRTAREMSGGQLQRIGIARALAARPELIVLDEVTSALDVQTARGILRLLRTLSEREGVAYLFISHDMSAVIELCDEVAVLDNGAVVAVGEPRSVLGCAALQDPRSVATVA